MDEVRVGKTSAYEKEARELQSKLNCQGVILIVIGGQRHGADIYEVASVIKGGSDILMKIPFFLMKLADIFFQDVRKVMGRKDSEN